MNHRRSAHSMIQVGDYIYAFGGQDDKLIASVERLNLTSSHSGKWEYLCEMPVALCNVGLIT